MGHMLNNTIQDVLVRRARLKGFNACWVPGTDHASIATEAKVVAKLKAEGIDKSDISREEFLEKAWEWTHAHGGVILEQLKKLGCSCDWSRTKFTMDEDMSNSVIKVFVKLYEEGYIYRGSRMVNWDPNAKTTLSDEEVIYKEQHGKLYFIKYKIAGTQESIIVATTRPETIFGDTAICINPKDSRYSTLRGRYAIVPICNREIPIVEDDYIDMEFGTGCLKVTPAHDVNDQVIGQKFNLESINIFNEDGSLNSQGLHYKGKDRFVVRREIEEELRDSGDLQKVEDYTNNVGTSERTGAIVEPRMSQQWFLKMEGLAKPALKEVLEGEVAFFPKKIINTYHHWMENIRDWNISRQLYWGHRIPAYLIKGSEVFVVAETPEKALQKAKQKTKNNNLKPSDLIQDRDVLDTWFSSWLWPISVFNGVLKPDNEEISYYYPTNDLVTAPEILFFWVARMIMAGQFLRGKKPFKNVYFTGIVRDKKRRKMSKSLGNSPDPLELIDKYGADGVRVGMLLSSPAGNDLIFDEALCNQGSGFCNKLWNAFRLVSSWEVTKKPVKEEQKLALQWFENRFHQVLATIEKHFEKYRISDALLAVYKLIWDDFCSWFLEIIKPEYDTPIDEQTYSKVLDFFEDILKVLHPFVPFISEEIWQYLKERRPKEALIISDYPKVLKYDEELLKEFEYVKDIISNIRSVRKESRLPFKVPVQLFVFGKDRFKKDFSSIISKLGNISKQEITLSIKDNLPSFRVKANSYYIHTDQIVDSTNNNEEIKRELRYAEGFLKSVRAKLSNKKFVKNAPPKVVAIEKKKQADALAKIETLKKQLVN
ncbi:valine--tRNA ligase [Elysia marginata]|uniref:valine--tRNA ligase n=1 Tax=Elysia marginata TaxID=1093978 RepID=A0AAV4FQE8_9GAST|nr:valine--tRNA ligase [Elysia marginata]